MQYHTVSWPDYANVGIENVDGSRGIEYSYANDPPITAGLAVKYPPFSGTPPVCQGPAVPALSATRDDTALVLSWTHLDPNESYTLWRGTGPYFDPDQGEGEQIWAGPATAGTMSRPDTTCIGDVNLNCFYAVQGSVVGAASGPSNRVGEFDFSLVAGAGAF